MSVILEQRVSRRRGPGVRLRSPQPSVPAQPPPGGSGSGGGSGGGGGAARPVSRLRPRGEPLVQPVALALAVGPADFRRLGRYGIFGGADYPGYLRRTERQLRALTAQGLEVHLRVLEPADFADFCAAHGLAPQEAAARVAYAADPELAGDPFVYDGQGLAELLPELVADHQARLRISVAYQALRAGLRCEGAAADGWPARLAAVLEQVSALYLALVAGLGEGEHRLLLRVAATARETDGAGGGGGVDGAGGVQGADGSGSADGADDAGSAHGAHGTREADGAGELSAAAGLLVERGRVVVAAREAEGFCVTLAAGLAAGRAGELLASSTRREPPRRERPRGARSGRPGVRTVRGWALGGGRLAPLGEDGVRAVLARAHWPATAGGPSGPARVRPGFVLPQAPMG